MKLTSLILSLTLILFLPARTYASWTELEVEVSSQKPKMKTLIYAPANLGQDSKLIIHLHGCLQSAMDLKEGANWQRVADEESFLMAFPEVPEGGVYAGCWDYYGEDHTLNNRHNVYLVQLVEDVLERYPSVHSSQVYFSGLSSGAAQSLLMACLAPKKVRGVFVVAAPSVGSKARDLRHPRSSVGEVAELCLKLSGHGQKAFKNQVAAFIFDPRDYVVHREHNRLGALALAQIYGLQSGAQFDLSDFPGVAPEGQGRLFLRRGRPRLSLMEHPGLGHHWPAGSPDSSGPFISSEGLNYPAYIAAFLEQNSSQ